MKEETKDEMILVGLLAFIVAVVVTGCHARPATHMPNGHVLTPVEAVRDDAYSTETLTASTHYAFAPEPKKKAPFDTRAAREGFAKTDVRSCGATIDGHARVTFAPDGTVASVTVDWPVDITAPARECVRAQLAKVRITEFEGPAVTLGTTWRAR